MKGPSSDTKTKLIAQSNVAPTFWTISESLPTLVMNSCKSGSCHVCKRNVSTSISTSRRLKQKSSPSWFWKIRKNLLWKKNRKLKRLEPGSFTTDRFRKTLKMRLLRMSTKSRLRSIQRKTSNCKRSSRTFTDQWVKSRLILSQILRSFMGEPMWETHLKKKSNRRNSRMWNLFWTYTKTPHKNRFIIQSIKTNPWASIRKIRRVTNFP